MLVQIIVDALEELLTTHIEHELLQHGSALGIGDAVEVDVRVVQIVDRRDDRVGGAQLVLAQCPALLAGAECGPSVLPFRGFGSGESGRELGEGFVEPQVVPPLHGHVVAEHMCASSCSTVTTRRSAYASVTFDSNTYWSRMVTMPMFSIAPALYSGT